MNSNFKRLFAILLIAAMALTLVACGGGSSDASSNKKEEKTPEYVYTSSYKPVKGQNSGTNQNAFYATFADETGFYCSVYEVVGKEIPEGEVEEWEGQYDIYETHLYRIDFDGNLTQLTGYEPIKIEGEHESSSGISYMCSDNNGGFYVYENAYAYWNEAPEGMTEDDPTYYDYQKYEEHYYIRHLAGDGSELSNVELSEVNNTNVNDNYSYFYVYSIASDKEGNVYLACDTSGVWIYDKDLNKLGEIPTESYADNLVKMPDGSLGVISWTDGQYGLTVIDVATMSYGKTYTLSNNAYDIKTGDGEYDFYYSSGISFYGYKLEEQKEDRLFSWISCDVDPDRIGSYYISEDGSVYSIINNWDDNYTNVTSELVTISKQPYDSVPHKTTLTLATQYLDWNLRSEIINFNRNNPTARIDVIEYNDEEGLTRLNTEIMAGTNPDIIDLNTISLDRLVALDKLEDLTPFIENDSEISLDNIFPSLVNAFSHDGKLYSTISTFSIQSVVGASSVVGDTPGWTYNDLYNAIAKMPEGCTIFDSYMTRDTILNYILYLEGGNLINWTTGECNFDSEDFKNMLSFANRFPAEYDWENEEYVDSYEAVSQGKQMLLNAYIYNFDDVVMYPALFGGDVTYVGYPTNDGVGNMFQVSNCYAMFNTCADKEGAWQFLRTLFTEKYQKSQYELPSNIKAYNAKLAEAMTPDYRKDENGNFVLDENGNKIEEPKYTWGISHDKEIKIYAVTQETADKILDMINSTTRVFERDDVLYDTVMTEAAGYFAGQKSVDDVAKLIQNKVSIYVNEQR